MTSVTLSEKLRKRLKRLAAQYDTTQGAIIEMALNIMEGKESNTKNVSKKDDEIKEFLNNISQEVRKKDPRLKKIHETLEADGVSIDDVISYSWDTDENFIGQ